jgi:hypothetical protein
MAVARIVDHDIQAPEGLDREVHRRPRSPGVRYIEREDSQIAAAQRLQALEPARIACGRHNPLARGNRRLDDRPAKPAGSAGNQPDL